MSQQILVINAGSSSIKFAVYAAGAPLRRTVQGMVSGIGGKAAFAAQDTGGAMTGTLPSAMPDHGSALAWLFDWLEAGPHARHLQAAGHRVVHGGEHHSAPVVIDDRNLNELAALAPLAPLHQLHNLAAIRALRALRPDLVQVACFDTAFHRTQPAVAQALALPPALTAGGLRRYGFHGLSYEFVAGALPDLLGEQANGRIIAAHLGNGASLCAMLDRKSVATTMGFSTLDGLVMGTRSGSMDPGVLLYLLQQQHMTPDEIEDLLYRRSGLLGVSGISNDMRILLDSQAPRAREAIDLFVYRIVREIGSLAAALGGIDALVFTGGIGEHAPIIRAMVCAQLRWLGLELDAEANLRNASHIATPASAVRACIVQTDEESVIAQHAARRLAAD